MLFKLFFFLCIFIFLIREFKSGILTIPDGKPTKMSLTALPNATKINISIDGEKIEIPLIKPLVKDMRNEIP